MPPRLATVFLVLACGCGSSQKPDTPPADEALPTGAPLSTADIAERTMPSVVLIKTPKGIGSGFFIWKDGRIATNLHVIAGAQEAVVVTSDGREYRNPMVMAVDDRRDLAVLRIRTGEATPALALGEAGTVRAGDRVLAFGHPMGLGNTVSDGLVSAVRVLDEELTVLQISAPIASGSSGGPLLNEAGQVIGVATAYASEGQNLNFGMPVNYLEPMLLSEKAQPLSELAKLTELGLLRGCTPDELRKVVQTLVEAIGRGAPLYNAGEHQECFEIYETTALDLVGALDTCVGVKDVLLAAVSQAGRQQEATAKAWSMRFGFDRILSAVQHLLEELESDG